VSRLCAERRSCKSLSETTYCGWSSNFRKKCGLFGAESRLLGVLCEANNALRGEHVRLSKSFVGFLLNSV
jgi:hypothetical protein